MKKIAIVTGGASGIGRAIVEHLASNGYFVALFDMNRKAADEVRQSVASQGGEVGTLIGDLVDYAAAAELVERVVSTHGIPWLLVNNVGGDATAPFLQTAPTDWQTAIDRNLVSALNMHHLVLPHMVKARSGRVVNISSDSARGGVPNVAVYAGCKGAIIAFTKCIAKEMAPHDILVNALCPGITATPAIRTVIAADKHGQSWVDSIVKQIPLGRMAVPEDVAPLVAFLAGPGGAYITGQTISVNGGKTMV